jgi:hypothetical protein
MSRRMVAFALQTAVILRQRSPWQSQGLPTKDLCTPQAAQKRGVPHLSRLSLGIRQYFRETIHLRQRKVWQSPGCLFLPLLCHPERRKIVRSRTILRSRGTLRLPAPARDRRDFSHTSRRKVRGENASPRSRRAQADTRSFDSVNGLASESIHCAQDDRVKREAEKNPDLDADANT